MEALGELQKKILNLVSERSLKNLLIANQMAVIVGRGHSTAAASIDSLLEKKFLVAFQEHDRARKYVAMTDKGACHALLYCNANLENMQKNYGHLLSIRIINEMRGFVRSPDVFDEIVSKFLQLVIQYNIFDHEGDLEEEIVSGSEYHTRKNHLLLAVKLELVTELLSEEPGLFFAHYERSGLLKFLGEIQRQFNNEVFKPILEEAQEKSSSELEEMEDTLTEGNKEFTWSKDPDDAEELR